MKTLRALKKGGWWMTVFVVVALIHVYFCSFGSELLHSFDGFTGYGIGALITGVLIMTFMEARQKADKAAQG